MLTDGCFFFFKEMSHLGCGHYFIDEGKTSTKMFLCEFLPLTDGSTSEMHLSIVST